MAIKLVTKKDIIRNINILDIASEFQIKVEITSSGNFNYRCKCPSVEHKNGNERTGSCYIDSVNNNFYCFGCNQGSNVIDFYMACAEVDFGTAMSVLRKRVDPSKASSRSAVVGSPNNLITLLDISKMLREAMLEHPDDLRWLNALMQRTDKHISKIGSDETKKARALYNKVKSVIKKRYK